MYKGKTPIYGIPFLKKGDKIQEKIEEQRALSIENLLFAGNCGMPKVIFEDGDYDIFNVDNNEYILTITAEKEYAVLGIINHRLFCSNKPVVFSGLTKGEFYYVYVAYKSELNTDATRFRRVLSPSRKDSDKYILLATVDLRGDEPIVNDSPDGKKYTKNILSHITDSTNPHGRDAYQDRLTICDKLTINENEVYETIYSDFDFVCEDSILIECKKDVVFVNVMPLDENNGFWVELGSDGIVVHSNKAQYTGKIKLEIRVK